MLHNGRVNDLPIMCRIIYANPFCLHHSRSVSFCVREQNHDCFDQGHIMNHKVLPRVCDGRVERTQLHNYRGNTGCRQPENRVMLESCVCMHTQTLVTVRNMKHCLMTRNVVQMAVTENTSFAPQK